MKPISDDIKNIIKKIFNNRHPVLSEIMLNWAKIVGPEFSSGSYPLKISNIKEKGAVVSVLHVAVKNSALSMGLSFRQEIIIERIAIYFGFKPVHKLKLKLES